MPIIRKDAPTGTDYVSDEVFEKEDENEFAAVSASTQAGWDAAEELMGSSGGQSKWTPNLKFGDSPVLVAFIKGAPVDSYRQHWVTRAGAQSFRCSGAECPLCAAGDRPSNRFVFFVLEFVTEGSEVQVKPMLWTCGRRVFEQLKAINSDERQGGPLEGHFFSVTRIGKGSSTQYSIQSRKLRDLEDAPYLIPAAAAEEELRKAQETAEPVIYITSEKQLQEVAAELSPADGEVAS